MNIATISKQIRAFADQLDATSEVEKPDPYAELKAAHAAGKVIQILDTQNRYVDADPTWQSPPERYRIKPEPAFQLPPPPPGMRWHREDGWKADDLPQGYRPLALREAQQKGDEFRGSGGWREISDVAAGDVTFSGYSHRRTTRPLTFEHAGKTWTYHRPGDPMPCDGEARIEIVCDEGRTTDINGAPLFPRRAKSNVWSNTIGWRYAEPQTKTVPLGPEDVRCGDEIMDEYQLRRCVITVGNDGVSLGGEGFIAYIHLTGRKIRRRDSDEFVPCSKEIPA